MKALAALTALFATAAGSFAQTESRFQSAARPFGLDIAGPVYAAGSDARSAEFQATVLPGLMATVGQNLGEYRSVSDVASKSLDPSKLVLATDADVRVYFLGEGAGYKNSLGVNLDGIGIGSGTPELIFPDASSRASWFGPGQTGGTNGALRSGSEPLAVGDFVDLGTVAAGQKLDFFLIADGASRSYSVSRVWTAGTLYNSDGLQHMASFSVKDSPYLLLSFEDMAGGGDQDFNDLVFAVEIGARNVEVLANPEPHDLLTFGLLGVVVHTVRRRMRPASA